jgi:hypothetical protein
MKVHKPKLFSDWRDFGREYAIVVLGVLTALLAQQAAASLEWRRKVDAAIVDMENELSGGDGVQAYVRMAIHDCVVQRLDRVRQAVEAGDRAQARKWIDATWLPNNTYDALARESATASDVASHMPQDTMLNYRIAYAVVPQLDRLADRELTELAALRAMPATGGTLEPPERLAALTAVEALRMDNDTMNRDADFMLMRIGAIPVGLDRRRFLRQLGDARVQYPQCITSPHRRFHLPRKT